MAFSLPVYTIFPQLLLAMSSLCSKFLSISALAWATAEARDVQWLLCVTLQISTRHPSGVHMHFLPLYLSALMYGHRLLMFLLA